MKRPVGVIHLAFSLALNPIGWRVLPLIADNLHIPSKFQGQLAFSGQLYLGPPLSRTEENS